MEGFDDLYFEQMKSLSSCHRGIGYSISYPPFLIHFLSISYSFLILGFDFGRSLWRKEPARERSLSAARNPLLGEL